MCSEQINLATSVRLVFLYVLQFSWSSAPKFDLTSAHAPVIPLFLLPEPHMIRVRVALCLALVLLLPVYIHASVMVTEVFGSAGRQLDLQEDGRILYGAELPWTVPLSRLHIDPSRL